MEEAEAGLEVQVINMWLIYLEIFVLGFVGYIIIYYLSLRIIEITRYLRKRRCGLHICYLCKYKQYCSDIKLNDYLNVEHLIQNPPKIWLRFTKHKR